ncbi:CLUMA_CG015523, isoform A [Clunio marinus]|uniref:CLUMA_CG015523, isoform A n=1 Tax=Clunio marinus TaxID=568069 RepID=A0A1J1IS14_9DIPT|nr:CLUMA_CG015523, isoform A [Clunio marinus]
MNLVPFHRLTTSESTCAEIEITQSEKKFCSCRHDVTQLARLVAPVCQLSYVLVKLLQFKKQDKTRQVNENEKCLN